MQNPMDQFAPENLEVVWPWRFFTASFVIFLASVLAYFGLVYGYEPYLTNRVAATDLEISQRVASIPKADQDKFIQIYSQIVNVKSLADNHLFTSNTLSLLERITHPRIYFTNMTVKGKERELVVDGVAESFSVLSEQLQIFAQTPGVDGYSLIQSQLNGTTVQFKASLKLNRSLLLPQ